LHADPGAWIRAAALLRDAAEVMAQDPDVFQVAEARRSLRASVLEACDELLAGPYGGRRPRELPIASPSLRRLLRAADDYLHANPACAADLAQLSVAISTPEARLRSAFLAILGISVTRYLLVRRLILVRAALRSPDCSWASVEDAALAHGFWNGQRFQRAYRAMFGEAPHKP
jgi:AraC family ethanolamine operon transcriptional activator